MDDFQLPDNILGRHPEEFFGAVGRVVCVCAVLEEKVTTLRTTLANAFQGQHTQETVSQQLKAARALSASFPDDARKRIVDYLDACDVAFRRRNDLVHSSFPAQTDGRIWGHRPARAKAILDGTADTIDTSIPELNTFIGRLAVLVQDFNAIHAVATAHVAQNVPADTEGASTPS